MDIALFGSTALGAPVSTTHTVAGAVTGVGVVTKGAPVNWSVFGQMALAIGLRRTIRGAHLEAETAPEPRSVLAS